MRNEMHNYLYRNSREITCENFYEESKNDIYFESENFKIDYKVIEEVCNNFKFYGSLERPVAVNLRDMGFKVVNTRNIDSGGFSQGYSIDFCKDVINRISGAVIWKSREYYHY
jgi:hypothetical protein